MSTFSILIPVALPSSGPELLRVARLLAPGPALRVTALHCRAEDPAYEDAGPAPLAPLLRVAEGVEVEPVTMDSIDVEADILRWARRQSPDLVLMGWHRPVVPHDEPQGPVCGVVEHAGCDVAVYLARLFRPIERILVPFYGGRHDRRALELVARGAARAGIRVTVLHVVSPERTGGTSTSGVSGTVEELSDGHVLLKVVEHDDPIEAAIQEAWTGYDLIAAGASETWGVDFSLFSERLQRLAFATPASLLVVHAASDQ